MKNTQKVLISAIGFALATGMAISQPTITASGGFLSIDGVEARHGAILRVVGPDGYRFIQEFPTGDNAVVDLKNTPLSADGKKLSTLPPGSYDYELLSRPGGKTVRGTFTIGAEERVASLPTQDEQSVLEAETPPRTAEALEASVPADDSVYIYDTADDGDTLLSLESNSPTASQNWKLYNQQGIFKLKTFDVTDGETDRMIIARNGNVNIATGSLHVASGITTDQPIGIGTNAPTFPLEISHQNAIVTLTDTDGGTSWKLVNDNGKFSLRSLAGVADVIVVEEGSLTNSLVITSSGVSVLSSRSAKTNIKPASAEQVLSELEKLPIYTWSYTEDGNNAVHIGPMAEEFHQQFGFGDDAKRISPMDTGGLALAGVKALQQELNKRDAEIAELKAAVELLLKKTKQ